MKKNNAFLFMTHNFQSELEKEFKRITLAVSGLGDAFVLYDNRINDIPPQLKKHRYFSFNYASLTSTNYALFTDEERRKNIPILRDFFYSVCHASVLVFYRNYPDYDFYWFIENDVRFSGNWSFLFSYFDNESDYTSSYFTPYEVSPEWPFWYLDHPVKSVPLSERTRSFNPIFRISNKALSFLNNCLEDGWFGHTEVLIASLLINNGFSIEDFGGDSSFCKDKNINRFYTSSPRNHIGSMQTGTLRFRPPHIYLGTTKNKIYHPVKPLKDTIRYYLQGRKRIK